MSLTAPKRKFSSVEEAEQWMDEHQYSTHFTSQHHAWACGVVLGSLLKVGDLEVQLLDDEEGNHTQHLLVTVEHKHYVMTIEPYKEEQ